MPAANAQRFLINGVLVDLDAGCLTSDTGDDVVLRPKPFAVLRHLAKNRNRVVTKDELIEAVWPGVAVGDDSLVQCVGDIRRAIGDADQTILRTVPRRGYRLVLPETAATTAAAIPSPETALRVWRPATLRLGAAAIAIAVAAGVASLADRGSDRASSGVLPSVVLVPFKPLTSDRSIERLAAGISEDVTADLARFPEFEVISQNTASARAKPGADPATLGRAVGASFVVDGSIQREVDQLRITATLIESETGRTLWVNRWDRPDSDFFAIQAEIAEAVANRMGNGAGLVQEAGRRAAHRRPPASLNAYELYLLGTEKLERINKEDIEEAIRLLERAVALDPGLARAWVELYHSYCLSVGFGADRKTRTAMADAAARRAAELDPMDPEAHAVLAMSHGTNNEFERARSEFKVALELAPNNAEILTFYTGWASTLGDPEGGAKLVDQAIRLDPDYPSWAAGIFAYAYFMNGQYQETLDMLERQTPENFVSERWAMWAGSLAALGRKDAAEVAKRRALGAFPDLTVEGVANAPGYSDAEHKRFEEVMKLAGFPSCASKEQLATFEQPFRLPECVAAISESADRNSLPSTAAH